LDKRRNLDVGQRCVVALELGLSRQSFADLVDRIVTCAMAGRFGPIQHRADPLPNPSRRFLLG
jgi:hypothetical protein